ncbi:dipeptidase [Pseudomonas syringae]|uniref:dipeptidase n=1 Tax=Pseudomonas syringae TaxID=317 RepID=UPI00042A3237|nr:dipeptidase [Pseudomonas syringae]
MNPNTVPTPARGAIRWEAHTCLPLLPNQDMSALLRYRDNGFHHVSVNVGMDMTAVGDVMQVIAGFRQWLIKHPENFMLAGTLADLQRARVQDKLAVSFDLEGSNMLLQDPAMVRLYADLGVRQMLLAYNLDNSCAGGCHGSGMGLTALGREFVGAINSAGIVMDCSHASKRASMEIIELSQRPVVFSHTNIKAVYDHPRTVDDEQIMACVESGGVIGLTGLGIFLGDPQASVEAFVRQIDYLAERAGTAHIGLGLDIELHPDDKDLAEGVNENDWWPKEFYGGINGHRQLQPEALGQVAEALLRLGYDAAQINGIFGGNFVRVAQATWP